MFATKLSVNGPSKLTLPVRSPSNVKFTLPVNFCAGMAIPSK